MGEKQLLEKQKRKAQKSLIKLEQQETSLLSKLIDMRTKELQALKKTNETEKAQVITEIQKLQTSLDNLVTKQCDQEDALEKSILLEKEKLQEVLTVLENRQESLNSTETYNNEDTKSLLSKCENMSLCEEKPDTVEIENDVEEEENSSDAFL